MNSANKKISLILMMGFLIFANINISKVSAYTVNDTEYRWVPIGFAVAPIYGEGKLEVSTTTTITASGGVLSGTSSSTLNFKIGHNDDELNNGEVIVQYQKYKIEKLECEWGLECLQWSYFYGSNFIYRVTALEYYTLVPLQDPGDTYHGNIPTSRSYDGISSTTWDIRYKTNDVTTDLRASPKGAIMESKYSLSIKLSSSVNIYGVEFGFDVTFTSKTSNYYWLDKGYMHYADFHGGSVFTFSYYRPPPPTTCGSIKSSFDPLLIIC